MTSAEPGEPLAVYLGAAGELVACDGSHSSNRTFHESRAGGGAWAPSSVLAASTTSTACDTDVYSNALAAPPRGLAMPPPCGSCGETTALVMQIHAPLLPLYPDRALLFFACVTGGEKCSRKQEAWVGVRVQGPKAAASTTAEEEVKVEPPPPASAALPAPLPVAADFWGLDDDGSAGGWRVEEEEEGKEGQDKDPSRVDFSRLATDLSSAAEALRISSSSSGGSSSGKAKPKKPPRDKEEEEGGAAEASDPAPFLWTQPGEAGPTLPSFFVSWAPDASSSSSSSSSSAAQRKGKSKDSEPESAIDDAHVAELLAKYEASERRGGGNESAAKASSSPSVSAASAATATAEANEALASSKLADSLGWSGEDYEPDSTPGASAAFLAFAKKVSKNPEQVARYLSPRRRATGSSSSSSSSSPLSPRLLWPEAEGPLSSPPPCPCCGSARGYEAQLMAPLVALIDEAGQWEEEEEEAAAGEKSKGEGGKERRRRQGKPALKRAPESWEWLTVAMATCLEDCHGAGEGANAVVALEEAVAVAFE